MNREKRYSVYMTKDYSEFKLLDGNRDPEKPQRIKRIKKSIEAVGYIPAPILVNEKMEVIDGQARLKVAEQLDIPVYFMVVRGIGLPECVALNQASTAWSIQDYIDSYVETGNQNFAILRNFLDKYDLPFNSVLYVLAGHEVNTDRIKNGTFVVNDESVKSADSMLGLLEVCKPLFAGVSGNHNRQLIALCYCFKQKDVDNAKLIKAIKERGQLTLKSFTRTIDWVAMFEELYNYKTRAENKVYLVDRYKREVTERNAVVKRASNKAWMEKTKPERMDL